LLLQTNFWSENLCIKVGITDAFANKICKNKRMRFATSVCPHVTTRELPNGIHEVLCHWIIKSSREQTSTLVKIGQKKTRHFTCASARISRITRTTKTDTVHAFLRTSRESLARNWPNNYWSETRLEKRRWGNTNFMPDTVFPRVLTVLYVMKQIRILYAVFSRNSSIRLSPDFILDVAVKSVENM
jgi:hypothetical protein